MEKTEYVLGEEIAVKVKNISNRTLNFPNTALGLGLFTMDGKAVCCFSGEMIVSMKPDREITITLHASEAGNYTVKMWDTSYSKNIIVKNPQSICKANGGAWDETYKECWGVSNQICKILNGTFNDCGGCGTHPTNPPQICPQMCIPFCTVK